MSRLLLAIALVFGVARADTRLATTVTNSAVFGNTNNDTPTIFEIWPSGYFCWTNFILDNNWPALAAKFQNVPLPCYFTPSAGSNGQAVILDHGVFDGQERTYEFWQAYWQNYSPNAGWHLKSGGADDNVRFIQTSYGRAWATTGEGVAASGLAYVPGVITVADLRSGVISHAVHISVPTSCTTWVSPATRTASDASPTGTNDCYEFGTVYKLPQSFAIPTSWPYVDRLIAQAAKDYGLIITDANRSGIGIRFENYQRPWGWWSSDGNVVDPYSDGTRSNLNYFQCPVPWASSCTPDQNNLFRPFAQVYAPNTQTFWQALMPTNSPSGGTGTLFASSSFWYTPIPTNAPLHPNSANYVTEFIRQKNAYYGTVGINTISFSSPVYSPGPTTPLVTVPEWNCQNKPSGVFPNQGLAQQWSQVPMPSYAQPADGNSSWTDAEMTLIQNDTLFEFWEARNVNGQWQACWGGRLNNVSSNAGIWPYPYGASATGLPYVGGQITAEELQRGQITHVIGISLVDLESWNIFSWPANRSDGYNPNSAPNRIPEGLRFRLDPTINVDALSIHPIAKIILKAAQTCGFVVWDKAGAISLRFRNPKSYTLVGQQDPYPALFNGTPDYAILNGVPWDRLQFLPLDYGKP